jgi:hypothetical protein
MKELLEMILLQSGADKAGSGHENYCREGGPRCPYNSRRVGTDGAKDARRSKDGSAEGFSHSSCEVVSFNLSTRMRE